MMCLLLPLRSRATGLVDRPMRRTFFILCAFISALAAGAAARAGDIGLSLSDAWIRTVLPTRPAAGYFTLSNQADTAHTLVGASSPACGMLMLHQSVNENGQEKMLMVKSVAIPAGGTVRFSPGGYHLMCMSPSAEVRPGNSIPITLRFQDGSSLTAPFPIHNATGQ